MTPKEAIKWIKEQRSNYVSSDPCATSLDIATEALEKQIPQKPWYQADDDECIYYHWECPSCGMRLFAGPHHCKCGQSIDWSSEE